MLSSGACASISRNEPVALATPPIPVMPQRLASAGVLAALDISEPVELLLGVDLEKLASSAGVAIAGTFHDAGRPAAGAITGVARRGRNGCSGYCVRMPAEALVIAHEFGDSHRANPAPRCRTLPAPAGRAVGPSDSGLPSTRADRSTIPSRSNGPARNASASAVAEQSDRRDVFMDQAARAPTRRPA